MCLAIPGKIIEIDGTNAIIDYGGVRKRASLMAMPDTELGDMVIVHAGFVISKIDREEAEKTLAVFREFQEAISAGQERDAAERKHIIFICTANMCRSPMAEGIARKVFEDTGLPFSVDSCGILDFSGEEPSRKAQVVCLEHGIDISAHRSQQLTADAARRADVILAMERSHIIWIEDNLGEEAACKAHLLTKYGNASPEDEEISDPIGGTTYFYREVFQSLLREIGRIAAWELENR